MSVNICFPAACESRVYLNFILSCEQRRTPLFTEVDKLLVSNTVTL